MKDDEIGFNVHVFFISLILIHSLLYIFDFLLQCNEKRVAKLSADMLTLLCDHVDKLLDFHPDLPKRIVEVGTHVKLTIIHDFVEDILL